MQTYSHFLINHTVGRELKKRGVAVDMRGVVLGSFMPDMPLVVLSIGYFFYNRYLAPNEEFIFGPRYDDLYFNNPFWVGGHNLFHSPTMLLFFILAGYFFGIRQKRKWGVFLLWFSLSCLLHGLLDIPTHHHDGPLLFFPFNWEVRFQSPVSYWDPDHYGGPFAIFEHVLDLLLIAYWIIDGRRRAKNQSQTAESAPAQST